MMLLIPLFIGTTELLLIGGIALLLFGGKKLPEMMHGLGKGVKEFKSGLKDDDPINPEATEHSEDQASPNQQEDEKEKESE